MSEDFSKREDLEEMGGFDIWQPENADDSVEGELITVTPHEEYGNQYTIETEEGPVRLPSHKVLQARLSQVQIGDKVVIVYTGEEPPTVKGRKPTKIYKVYRKK